MGKLFSDITELKKYISVTKAYSIDEFDTREDYATEKYIKPWLGQPQIDALVTAIQSPPLSTNNKVLLEKIQSALAHFIFYEHIPFAQVIIDDSGISRKENEHFKTAYANQVQMLLDKTINTAYDNLEYLLNFLEANETNYPLWVASDGYTKNKKFFINTASEFNDNYTIIQSRQTFKALFPVMDDVEMFYILPILGQLFFDELKQKIFSKTTFTAPEKVVLKLIKKAVSTISIARAVKNSLVFFTSTGVHFYEHNQSTNNKIEKQGSSEHISIKVRETQKQGEDYLEALKNYLSDNITSFPTFENDISVNPLPSDENEDDYTPNSFFV